MSKTQMIRKQAGLGLGLLCFVTALFLSLPGVEVARAEDEPVPATKPSPSAVAPKNDTEKPESARGMYDPRRNGEDRIVLNTRGYNYGPTRPKAPSAQTLPPAKAVPSVPQTKSGE